MADVKTSMEVGYTDNGEAGKQCKDCANYAPVSEISGNCLGHNISVNGSCNSFQVK